MINWRWSVQNPGIIEVAATITETGDGWCGTVAGHDTPTIAADKVSEVRHYLVSQVWAKLQDGEDTAELGQATAVRMFTHTLTRHQRSGQHAGSEVEVSAVADRFEDGWRAQTLGGPLGVSAQAWKQSLAIAALGGSSVPPFTGQGETYGAAVADLADKLMLELEFNAPEADQEWSALRLKVTGRKTFTVASLGG